MVTSPFWAITQRVVVISDRRFGTTDRSHPQGPSSRVKQLAVEDGTDYPETSVRNYHYLLRHNPEEHRSDYCQRLFWGKLKFPSIYYIPSSFTVVGRQRVTGLYALRKSHAWASQRVAGMFKIRACDLTSTNITKPEQTNSERYCDRLDLTQLLHQHV